jgi:hypothetical protein
LISRLSLWIKEALVHRALYPLFLGLLINRAEGQLFTGLNPQKSVLLVEKKVQVGSRGQSISVQLGK